MKKTLGVTVAVTLLFGGVLFVGRGDNGTNFEGNFQNTPSPRKPTSALIRKDKNYGAAQEERVFEQAETLMQSVPEIEVPRELNIEQQENRMVACASANMSDAQMVKLQNLRRGERVRRADGTLMSPYVEKNTCDDGSVCRVIVVNGATGVIVYDGEWAVNFTPTGVGQEVVKSAIN